MVYSYTYRTPFGKVLISENQQGICGIKLQDCSKPVCAQNIEETPLIKQAYLQLCEYFKGKRKQFTLPLSFEGTKFQKAVWNELCNIPYGQTISYKELAIKIGNPKACRAVGLANNKNPIWIVVPCHRVVGSNGKLTGYAGGLDMKQELLNIEQQGVGNTKFCIKEELETLADEKYKKFASSLLPETHNMIGVRLPELRKLARKYAKYSPEEAIHSLGNTFEETMLHGMMIGYLNPSQYSILEYCGGFLPKIDNWSVCDSFCSGLKFVKTHQKEMWDFMLPLFTSTREYDVRFALVMSLFYFMDEEHLPKVLAQITRVTHKGYYAQMAAAWAISICFVNNPQLTFGFLQDQELEDFIFNKSIQKICESRQVSAQQKEKVRSLKQSRIGA